MRSDLSYVSCGVLLSVLLLTLIILISYLYHKTIRQLRQKIEGWLSDRFYKNKGSDYLGF